VNTYFIAQLGTVAQAAMGVFGYFFMIIIFLNQIIGLGSFSIIARSFGAKDFAETRRAIGQTFMLKFVMAGIAAVLGVLLIRPAYIAFGSEPAVADMGSAYGVIFFASLPLFFSGYTLNTSFRAIGDMVTPLWITAVSVVINLFLDYVLIFGKFGAPALGIRGAAVATVIAQVWILSAGFVVFVSGRTFLRLTANDLLQLSWSWTKRILRIGVPAAVGENAYQLGNLMIGYVINLMGTVVMAANAIVMPILAVLWIAVAGLGQAVMTLVGQNLGAKKPARSERSVHIGIGIGLLLGVAISAVSFAFAPAFVSLFAKEEAVFALGCGIMRIATLSVLISTVAGIISAAFWGSGYTRPPMVISILTMWCVQVPLVWALVRWLGLSVYYIWWSGVIAAVIYLLLMWFLFRQGSWKRVRV